jgi:hypothetical protein
MALINRNEKYAAVCITVSTFAKNVHGIPLEGLFSSIICTCLSRARICGGKGM